MTDKIDEPFNMFAKDLLRADPSLSPQMLADVLGMESVSDLSVSDIVNINGLFERLKDNVSISAQLQKRDVDPLIRDNMEAIEDLFYRLSSNRSEPEAIALGM